MPKSLDVLIGFQRRVRRLKAERKATKSGESKRGSAEAMATEMQIKDML